MVYRICRNILNFLFLNYWKKEREQALIGALMFSNNALQRVSGFLKAEHFSNEGHRLIYKSIVKLIDGQGKVANPSTISADLTHEKEFKKLGGHKYLSSLYEGVYKLDHAHDYGRIIYDIYLIDK